MTNYEKIMNEMTPAKLAILLDWHTPCFICAYRNTVHCGFHCLDGIEEWLKEDAIL